MFHYNNYYYDTHFRLILTYLIPVKMLLVNILYLIILYSSLLLIFRDKCQNKNF